MATDLGKAYVQIMPSAKGISGSIQKIVNPEAAAAGKSAGSTIASNMSKSLGKAGKTLTKFITTPVVGATAAVSGLVGALGFKRLVGLDTAQAKLKGLGYNAEEVERISGQVETAIMGGMTTMGEGVDIAAGALAAGVKEGAELERYIKLVGDAAVGANRPVDEMAQIFNRVQGGGRLMTQELNMIEMGLPGFAQAMADELAGGSLEAFREMVTNGQVGSDEFLNVMDDFAGGMAGAYSESWAGMAKNTLAYVGIIGEALLEGLFEDGKKGLADFIEVLKSDEVQQWAVETGEKIREIGQTIVEFVKGAIDWWTGLSDGMQTFIMVIGGIIVALGPVLMIAAKIAAFVPIIAGAFKILGVVIAALMSPIGLVIAAVIGAATLIFIYWEPIKEFFLNMWEAIKEAGLMIWESLKEAWQSAKENLLLAWDSVKEFFSILWETVKEIFSTTWNAIKETVSTVVNGIKNIVTTVFNTIKTFITTVLNIYKSIFLVTWNAIKTVVTTVVNAIRSVISSVFNAIKSIISSIMSGIRSTITSIWNGIRSTISSVVNAIRSVISSVFSAIQSVISSIMSGIRSTITSIWNGIKSTVTSVVNGIKNTVSNVFNSLKSVVSSAFSGVKNAVRSGMNGALNIVKNVKNKFKNAGKNIVTSIADGIKGAAKKVTDAISNVTQKARDYLPFSPPKTGPLKDIMDVKWGETISAGIEDDENIVEKAMDKMLSVPLDPKTTNFQSKNTTDLLEATLEQNRILMMILNKDPNFYINGREVAKATADPMIDIINEREVRRSRARG